VRDSDGQKAFSKLRSSIGGIYAWRLSPQTPAEYQPKSLAERDALIREANFAFLQSFTFCPYSPEAVFRYAQLLLQLQRFDDAILVAETCLVLDPNNAQVAKLRDDLKNIKASQARFDDTRKNLQAMKEQWRTNPAALTVAFDLVGTYLNMQQTNEAVQVLDEIANSPYAQGQAVLTVARIYAQMTNWVKLERTLQRFVKVDPQNPNGWYDLAALKASLGKPLDSLPALKKALELSADRLKKDPKALDLLKTAQTDRRFDGMRHLRQFQALVPP
jgi:tetratricopeptide (TPR) repeat protein